MRFALGELRMSPGDFWELTPWEWAIKAVAYWEEGRARRIEGAFRVLANVASQSKDPPTGRELFRTMTGEDYQDRGSADEETLEEIYHASRARVALARAGSKR